MLGVTYAATIDAALDHIRQQANDKAEALAHLQHYIRRHPDAEHDPSLIAARIALQ